MRQKVCSHVINASFLLFAIVGGIIVLLNMFSDQDYMCKTTFKLPNLVLLMIGVMVVGGCLFLVNRGKFPKCKWNINIATFILFCISGYICYNILFATGWEVQTILKNAKLIVEGQISQLDNYYFSIYPNNQFITCLFAAFYKINQVLGIFNDREEFFLIVLIQCALSALVGKLLFQIIKDYSESDVFAWLGWGIYVILIVLSGWSVIPYTDMMGLIFPIAILRIYQTMDASKPEYMKWFGICVLSFWGYKMKPQAIIVVVALFIVEGLNFIKNYEKGKFKRNLEKNFIVVVIAFFSVIFSFKAESVMLEQAGFVIDKEASLGVTHIVMMGLNEENNGVWYSPDVEFSKGISSQDERTTAQLKVIRQRLSDYGVMGLLNHLHKKTLTIFNDGTFAWGHEGNFFNEVYDDKNEVVAPFLKNVYYVKGDYYGTFATIRQMLWLVVFTISLGVFCLKKDKFDSVLVISLLGIILFTYVFEARARYLILYVPFWIIATCLVLYHLCQSLKGMHK